MLGSMSMNAKRSRGDWKAVFGTSRTRCDRSAPRFWADDALARFQWSVGRDGLLQYPCVVELHSSYILPEIDFFFPEYFWTGAVCNLQN